LRSRREVVPTGFSKRATIAALRAMLAALLLTTISSSGRGAEGMWLVQEIPDRVLDEMRRQGSTLDGRDIWNPNGTGLASAIVRIGATGAFVSPEGLILTNHHVAFGAVQRMSTPEANYIENGFLADSRAEEVPALGYIAHVLVSAEDVTAQILAAAATAVSPLERHAAIETRTKQIIADGEAKAAKTGSDVECEVSSFSGARYILYTFLKLKDVRVAYVPSRAIGEYGGDIDNWMWPRHAGDFSFLRAYVGPDGAPAEYSPANVPYRPTRYLKIASRGLEDGDFALILGFPRITHRYLTSYALDDYATLEYPERIRLDNQMVEILNQQSLANPAAEVAVAGAVKNLNNYLKKNRAVLVGFEHLGLVERERAMEAATLARLAPDPELAAEAGAVLDGIAALYGDRAAHFYKDMLLQYATKEGLLGQAMTLYKWSVEKARPDIERDPEFMDREIDDLRRGLRVFQTGFHPACDRAVLRMLLSEMASLPEGQRIRAYDEIFESGEDLDLDGFLDHLYANTRLAERDARLAMFDFSRDELVGLNDAFIDLAARLYPENEERLSREKVFSASLDMLTPRWLEVLARQSEGAMYPDGNSTLRLNYGVVRGYSPADAVWYEAFTALAGVAAKHSGEAPFDCPERILQLASAQTYGPFAPAWLGDVPVDFLTTNDSTNGNSGSPVLNARGELVGCLFDGNYEALTCDFAFDEALHRSINVDIRYILWVATYVDDARSILEELNVR
jgi:hypothetical protein